MVKGFQERADALSQLGGRDHDLSRPSGNVSGRVEKKKGNETDDYTVKAMLE